MASVAARAATPAGSATSAKRRPSAAARSRSSDSGSAPSRSRSRAAGSRPAADARARQAGKRKSARKPSRASVQVGAGVAWGLVLAGALALSSLLTAVVLIPVAAIATASGVRATEPRGRSRSASRRPSLVLLSSLGASVLVPLFALAGPLAALAALVIAGGVVTALVLASGYAASARPLRTVGSRLVASLAPVLSVTCVVVARHQGATLALALVGATLAYDAAAYLMGNARTPLGGPVGVASGVVSVAVVSVFVAAVMNPPFTGSRPWVVFGAVAVLAPLGVRLCQQVGGSERLPAMRRVDSLSLVAPMWVLAAATLLHR